MSDSIAPTTVSAESILSDDMVQKQLQINKLRKIMSEPKDQKDEKKLKQACQDFEAIFMKQMWTQMRATVPKAGLFNSRDEQYYQSMYDQELTSKLSKSGGIGLGDMMYKQIKSRMANRSKTPVAPEGAVIKPVNRVGLEIAQKGTGDVLSPLDQVTNESVTIED